MEHDSIYITQITAGGLMPIEEAENFQRRSVKLLVMDQTQTEAPPVPSSTSITSSLFEYDITGLRVKSVGQTTGGFFREVAENESAFVFSLQDEVSLYILNKIASSDNSININSLGEILRGSTSWLRFSILYKAGLIEVISSQVRVSDRGLRELGMIQEFCNKSAG